MPLKAKKTAAIFITTAEFSCEFHTPKRLWKEPNWNYYFYICKAISKQVFWLVSYKHFFVLPSQFPNDRLSPTDKKHQIHTATVIVEDSHLFPFSPTIPRQNSRHFVWIYLIFLSVTLKMQKVNIKYNHFKRKNLCNFLAFNR